MFNIITLSRISRDADPSPPSSAVVKKEYSYTSIPSMGRTACTDLQSLYKGALYLSFNPNFFFAVYEIMWKNIVQPSRPQMTIWSTYIVRWIPKARDTHSEYVTFIAFPPQQWLLEAPSLLR